MCCSKEWVIIGMAMIQCISAQLWGITCNKHCCEAFFQIKWVLFSNAMNQSSCYNPIFCPAVSAECQCFEIPCHGHKQVKVSCMCMDPGCHSHALSFCQTFVCRTLLCWVSVSCMRARCAQPGCNQLHYDSKQYQTFNVIKSIAIECVHTQQGGSGFLEM